MARVELKNIRKVYDGKEVVCGVNLTISDGEFMVLVGPSGCGKSTILRMIAGLEEITSGQLYIDGVVSNHLSPRKRDVAMVFQNYALYPHMTVRENISFGLKMRGMKKQQIEELVVEVATLLEIDSLLDRYPRQLSGGQRQRVAMGRAIVRKPKVFLFDEPLSNLDAALRAQMRVELRRLHQKISTTTIYVTHDHVEAMTLADRIAVINKGRFEQVASAEDIFERPVTKFVAGFIGSPPMNFLEGIYGEQMGGRIEGERFTITLDEKTERRVRRLRGGRVEVGFRPQHLTVVSRKEGLEREPGGLFRGKLEVKETMGWETYLHVRLKESLVVAQIETSRSGGLRVGREITLKCPVEKIHIFDQDGVSVLHGARQAKQ